MKTFEKAFKDDADLPETQTSLDALNPNNSTDKPEVRSGLRNDTTVAQLIVVFQTVSFMDKVNQAKSTD